MDADDDEPLGRPPATEQTSAGTNTASADQTDSHPTEDNDQDRRPDAVPATTTDLVLEQDA